VEQLANPARAAVQRRRTDPARRRRRRADVSFGVIEVISARLRRMLPTDEEAGA
jgi:hypothetical protein